MWRKLAALTALLVAFAAPNAASAEPSHAIAMHGEPKLPADFTHFPYANPDAPKGGRMTYGVQGSFDSLNPFIVQGAGARGLADLQFGNNVFETLMQRSADEPFTLYPLLAKTVETDRERSFVEFTLDPDARFSDGNPVTPEDVIFTVELLRDKGWPRYAVTARKISTMEKVGTHGVRFTFADPDRELPLILGLMPVLPKHAIDAATFDRSTLKPLVGSGPYLVDQVRPGELLVLRRDPNYWAAKKPSKLGFDNFDEIRLTYIRDDNTLFEAFKKGLSDIQIEATASRWATGYNFPAVAEGRVVKETFRSGVPSGMRGMVLNSRRPAFADPAVRRAIASLFDFEWSNKNLFSGAYTRTRSYFDNSELSSFGSPASDRERALLAPFPGVVLPEVMAGTYAPPVSDGTGRDRAFLKIGFDLLKEAGYSLEGGRMVKDGRPLAFEVVLNGRNGEEIAAAFQRTLARLGITMGIRSVDTAQYQRRLSAFDFDAVIHFYPASLSPGVEQIGRWGSSAKDREGTMNYSGASSPAIDAMIDAMLDADAREDFVSAVRAFDRVLISGFHVVPFYHQPEQWVARWSHVERPATTPLLGYQLSTWWHSGK